MNRSLKATQRWCADDSPRWKVGRSSFFFVLALHASSYVHAVGSHCQTGEETYFNCQLRNSPKVASVCGAGYDIDKKQAGYLQYRFGSLGKMEFSYPSSTNADDMLDKFNFSALRTADGSQEDSMLGFKSSEYFYSVNYGVERRIGRGDRHTSTIMVWKEDNRKGVKILACKDGQAGRGLSLGHVIPLMSSPGRPWYRQLW